MSSERAAKRRNFLVCTKIKRNRGKKERERSGRIRLSAAVVPISQRFLSFFSVEKNLGAAVKEEGSRWWLPSEYFFSYDDDKRRSQNFCRDLVPLSPPRERRALHFCTSFFCACVSFSLSLSRTRRERKNSVVNPFISSEERKNGHHLGNGKRREVAFFALLSN